MLWVVKLFDDVYGRRNAINLGKQRIRSTVRLPQKYRCKRWNYNEWSSGPGHDFLSALMLLAFSASILLAWRHHLGACFWGGVKDRYGCGWMVDWM